LHEQPGGGEGGESDGHARQEGWRSAANDEIERGGDAYARPCWLSGFRGSIESWLLHHLSRRPPVECETA
jgi:hypothetical protein